MSTTTFLHSTSKFIKFHTVLYIISRSKEALVFKMKAIIHLYTEHSFVVTSIQAGNEFRCTIKEIFPMWVNILDHDNHVYQAERSIRMVKEWTRNLMHGKLFNFLPSLMNRSAVEATHSSLNQFTPKYSVSELISPLTIVTGKPNNNYHYLSFEFG